MTPEDFKLLCCYTGKYVDRGVSRDRIAFIFRVLLDCLTLEIERHHAACSRGTRCHSVEVALQAGR